MQLPEQTILKLAGYDGLIYTLASGYWLKFEVRAIGVSVAVPHGVRYSFTMHNPAGDRVLGFDNAHGVPHMGSRFIAPPVEADHWHRDESDEGRPYAFVSADQLIVDFFAAVDVKLAALGLLFEMKE